MFVWHIKYQCWFEGAEGWVAAETNVFHASANGADAVSELFTTLSTGIHLDDRNMTKRAIIDFRLRGLTLMGEVDIISPTVLSRMGIPVSDEQTQPMDIRGNGASLVPP